METIDAGLLLVRVVVGVLLVGHGSQKLFGWFGGYGPRGTAGYLAGLGYRPGLLFALLAGIGEAAGGLLLILGLATPVAAALVVATMVNVYAGHAGNGIWNQDGGWEYPLVLGTLAAALSLTGPGSIALAAALGGSPPDPRWAIGGIAIGLVAGLTLLLVRGFVAAPRGAAGRAD